MILSFRHFTTQTSTMNVQDSVKLALNNTMLCGNSSCSLLACSQKQKQKKTKLVDNNQDIKMNNFNGGEISMS